MGVARALVGTGEEARARSLLELLDDHLREGGSWALRLQLLKRAGALFVPTDKLHPTLSSTLGKLYSDRSTYKALYKAVGLHKATTDIPKTWEKVDRLEGLLAFDVGTVVAMEGKGVGRVVEANLGLESFKVDFERIRGLTVGFKAAPKLLRPLAPDHVLLSPPAAPWSGASGRSSFGAALKPTVRPRMRWKSTLKLSSPRLASAHNPLALHGEPATDNIKGEEPRRSTFSTSWGCRWSPCGAPRLVPGLLGRPVAVELAEGGGEGGVELVRGDKEHARRA